MHNGFWRGWILIFDSMDFDDVRIVRLGMDHSLSDFDCGNHDLNEFLMNDAKEYQKRLIAVTYLVKYHDKITAFFSLSNDKLSIKDSDKSTWRKVKKLFPHNKHRGDYPAVKVGRLAVGRQYQGYDIGTRILDFIKYNFIDRNRTGCAFVTVDALKASVDFYSKNKFKMLGSIRQDSDSLTVPMYYNLSELI